MIIAWEPKPPPAHRRSDQLSGRGVFFRWDIRDLPHRAHRKAALLKVHYAPAQSHPAAVFQYRVSDNKPACPDGCAGFFCVTGYRPKSIQAIGRMKMASAIAMAKMARGVSMAAIYGGNRRLAIPI
jgi:hypothetical protein